MAVAVARLDEIKELADAGGHCRPIRHHLGIMAFGVTAWTARKKVIAQDLCRSIR